MAKSAIPCLLATLCLFSGCLGEGDPAHVASDLEPSAASEGIEPAPATEAVPVAPPKCPESHSNTYGTSLTIGGEYIWTGVGGNVVVYYQESNGCSGLQIEEEWAHNPDTKVAEVPGAATVEDSRQAPQEKPRCPIDSRGNHGTWTQVEDTYIVSPYGGFLLVVYQESNGCTGLQTEGEWAHNPDSKVAEVPYPLDGTDPSANA